MNGLNSLGGANGAAGAPAAGPSATDGASFDEIFAQGVFNTSAVLFQFIGADILQTVMRDESAVD